MSSQFSGGQNLMLLNCMRPANDLSKYDPPIALLFARGNLPLTSPRRIFMRSSVQISSPHSAYSAHKAFATCSWSRISLLGACHMSFSWHHNQGKVHLCCNKCQGPEQTRPNHLGKRLPKTRPHGRCIAGVHLATWKPNKKCNKLSKLSQFFRSTSWCAWGTWKYMEVQADAAVLLHDHHSLQFVGNPMSFSASPTWSFWLLETPLVGSPWGGSRYQCFRHPSRKQDFQRSFQCLILTSTSRENAYPIPSSSASDLWNFFATRWYFWNNIARRKSFNSTPTHLWFYWVFLRRGSWVSPRALLGHSTWEIYMNDNTQSSTLIAVQDDSNKTRLWPWLLIAIYIKLVCFFRLVGPRLDPASPF